MTTTKRTEKLVRDSSNVYKREQIRLKKQERERLKEKIKETKKEIREIERRLR